jgi:hypothetical protein
MRLKTMVPCTKVSMPGQAKDPTQVDSSPGLKFHFNAITDCIAKAHLA